MISDKPDISPFERAISQLEEGIARYKLDENDDQIRDGLIQRFEFTYELGLKMLKRYLEYASPNPGEVDEMTFQDMIRTANEQNLVLGDWPVWRKFREMRARSSHTYDQETADTVVADIPRFVQEDIHLRNKLRERLR